MEFANLQKGDFDKQSHSPSKGRLMGAVIEGTLLTHQYIQL